MEYKWKVYEWQKKFVQRLNEQNTREHNRRVAAKFAAVAACSHIITTRKKYKKKKYWVADIYERRHKGGFYETTFPRLKLEDVRFRNYFRMTTSQFEDLLYLTAPKIERQHVVREPIGAEQRLCLTLRYLASGDSMTSLSYQYLLGLTTVSNIIADTCKAIWEILSPIVLKEPTEEEWKSVASDFQRKWQFPHCIGALDGKHIVMQCPQNSGSMYYNYKGSHSIVLMAMCDANYIFTLVDIAAAGRQSDGGIFRNSVIGSRLEKNNLNVPAEEDLYEGGSRLPYVIVADEAFSLTTYLMRPYSGKCGLTVDQRIYNYRLSRARRVIENAFGILAAQWRIFRKPIIANVEHVEQMVQAAVCLHNWLRFKDNEADNETYIIPGMVDQENADGSVRHGSWRNTITASSAFHDITNCGTHTYSRKASTIRDTFAEYFNEEGSVPWQFMYVHL